MTSALIRLVAWKPGFPPWANRERTISSEGDSNGGECKASVLRPFSLTAVVLALPSRPLGSFMQSSRVCPQFLGRPPQSAGRQAVHTLQNRGQDHTAVLDLER